MYTMLLAMQQASINFYNAIKQTYEPNWAGHEDVLNAVEVSKY